MNTLRFFLLLTLVGKLPATDLTLDPDLYQEALRQVQGGDALVVTKRAPEQLATLWEEAMITPSPQRDAPEARLARQLRLTFLFKELNPSMSFAAIQELLKLHERALQGDMTAHAHILQALVAGRDAQHRRWPHSERSAQRWLAHAAALKSKP